MSTKVVTEEVRFGYLRVLEPYQGPNDKEKRYSVMLIIDKDDEKTLAAYKAAVAAAKELGKEKVWKGKIPSEIRLPLRDGDTKADDNPELAGKYFMNVRASEKYPPQVGKIVDAKFVRITDPMDIKSGDYGKASISLFAYSNNGNNGISAGLSAILWKREGDSLSGAGTNVNSDFADDIAEGGQKQEEAEDAWMNG